MKTGENDIPKVIQAYKEVGETPLEVIELLKSATPALKDVPITYAGRLDPMAEGVLLLLVGDEVHNKDKYLALEKEYEFTILFGFSTDTYDLLGRIVDTENGIFKTAVFEKMLKTFAGKQEQAYPPYSSKPVEGKPLFEWAREGRLHEIEIPRHEVTISSLEPASVATITSADLKEYIRERVGLVNGDFRQKEIVELWNAYIDNAMETEFTLATCRVVCSSGTYVRTLVHDIGARLGAPATTFAIRRARVGEYVQEED